MIPRGIAIIFFALVLLSVVYVVVGYNETSWHEAAHKAIFGEAGLSSKSVVFFDGFDWAGNTTVTGRLWNSSVSSDAVFLAQANVEAVGYHFFGLILALFFLAFVLFSLFVVYSEGRS